MGKRLQKEKPTRYFSSIQREDGQNTTRVIKTKKENEKKDKNNKQKERLHKKEVTGDHWLINEHILPVLVQVLEEEKKNSKYLSTFSNHIHEINDVVRPISITAWEAACRNCTRLREFVFHSFNERINSSDESHVTVF